MNFFTYNHMPDSNGSIYYAYTIYSIRLDATQSPHLHILI
jgi:hypothetical protein